MSMKSIALRVARHVAWRSSRVTTMALDAIRRGDRTITMTPPVGPRFGNWLYLWLHAYEQSVAGRPTLVLEAPGMASWLEVFPALKGLTVSRPDVRFHDRREWGERSLNQRFGVDFPRASLAAFIRFALAAPVTPDRSGTLVVNVRRGDYYERPELRERYGFDQVGYITAALDRFEHVQDVLVVSDDPVWCQAELDRVLRSGGASVRYAAPEPVANFLAVCSASRIIGTNSTFSYWAAYVADEMHRDAQIVMPRFHSRLPGFEDANQLDPRWTAIDGFH